MALANQGFSGRISQSANTSRGSRFGGIVVFAAYSFEAVINFGFMDALTDYVTSITVLGPVLATFAFNIGPKSYGKR